MKEHISHPARMILNAAGFLILAGLVVLYAVVGNWTASLVFLVLACLYFWFCRDAFHTVTIDKSGITQSFFGKKKTFKWENIREAGITAASVVRRKQHNKRPSRCYIYYSVRNLDNGERLAAGAKPAEDIITVTYTPERLRQTVAFWPNQIILFNVTGRELFGEEKTLPDLNMKEIHY